MKAIGNFIFYAFLTLMMFHITVSLYDRFFGSAAVTFSLPDVGKKCVVSMDWGQNSMFCYASQEGAQ